MCTLVLYISPHPIQYQQTASINAPEQGQQTSDPVAKHLSTPDKQSATLPDREHTHLCSHPRLHIVFQVDVSD